MKIVMVGAGYVGLVSAAGFAEFGNHVTIVDSVPDKVDAIRSGSVPFYEPGLPELVQRNVQDGRLTPKLGLDEAVLNDADIVFLAVGTPQSVDGSANLRDLWDIVDLHLAAHSPRAKLVVVKSTVPPGTCARVREKLRSVNGSWHVASNPEFLREGTAVEDFMRPDRVVVGAFDGWSESMLRRLYEPVSNCGPIICMDPASSELTKYVSNAMLASRISWMNEVSRLAEKVGADADMIRRGVGLDKRLGPKYLYPGPGFGGSCFTKDLQALSRIFGEAGLCESAMAEAVLRVNVEQKHVPVEKLKRMVGSLSGKTVAVWGLAFKPFTDDVRDSPAIVIVQDLLDSGAKVRIHDPKAIANFMRIFPDVVPCSRHYDAAADADGLILVTEWREYRTPDFMLLRSMAPRISVVDARNVWREEDAREAGVPYARIGRVYGAP